MKSDLFLSNLNVPTRAFTEGFAPVGKPPVKRDDGQTLVEYFGIQADSNLILAPGEQAGKYQIAILADDGVTMSLLDSNGKYVPLVTDEGNQNTTMACASRVVHMVSGRKIPMKIGYFQGPRHHIALLMMWRRVPGEAAHQLAEQECGKAGNDRFFDSRVKPSKPSKVYEGLLARGWRPMKPENFLLTSGYNQCTMDKILNNSKDKK